MVYQDIFGVRRYMCQYRAGHTEIFVNLATGERIPDDKFNVYHQAEEEYPGT